MGDRMKPILGSYVAFLVISYIGVTYFFNPQAGTEILPAPWSLVVGGIALSLIHI